MQRKKGTENELGKTISSYESIGASFSIDRTVSSYLDAGEKVQKNKKLILTGTYEADIAKYTPGALELVFQWMLEDIDTKDKTVHISYKDMESLDFQIMLTDNYYMNPNSMHISFPMKILKSSDEVSDIDTDLITVNIFAHLVKEISITRYGNDK